MRPRSFYLLAILGLMASCTTGNPDAEVRPRYEKIEQTLFASGQLEPDDLYKLTAQSEGYLVDLRFEEGQLVKTGQVLCVIDNRQNSLNQAASARLLAISRRNASAENPALKQIEANLRAAKSKLAQDEKNAQRYERLLNQNAVSAVEAENARLALETSRANVKTLEESYQNTLQTAEQQLISQEAQEGIHAFQAGNNQVLALQGGKVYRKYRSLGEYVRKGDVLAEIGNPNRWFARLQVDENNIAQVHLGMKGTVRLNSVKNQLLQGKVAEILPAFEESTQSFPVKLAFDSVPPFALLGSQLEANLLLGAKEKALVIPRPYLDYGNKVRVKGEKEPRIVKTGFVSTGWVEILEGLKDTDVIEKPKP